MSSSKIEDLVTSRKYKPEELVDGPFNDIKLGLLSGPELTTEDIVHEDTMPVYISMPRSAWKYVYAMAKQNNIEISKTASRLLFEFIMLCIRIDGVTNDEINKEKSDDNDAENENMQSPEQLEELIDKFGKIAKNVKLLKKKKRKGE